VSSDSRNRRRSRTDLSRVDALSDQPRVLPTSVHQKPLRPRCANGPFLQQRCVYVEQTSSNVGPALMNCLRNGQSQVANIERTLTVSISHHPLQRWVMMILEAEPLLPNTSLACCTCDSAAVSPSDDQIRRSPTLERRGRAESVAASRWAFNHLRTSCMMC